MQSMHVVESQVKERGPLWRLAALLSGMVFWTSPSPCLLLLGRLSLLTGKRGVHFRRSLLCRYMRAASPSHAPLRLLLRGWLRISLPLLFRGPVSHEGGETRPQRGLRAWRFADIPTAPPGQNIKGALVSLSIFPASLALDACATTSALARQRFSITSATGIALVLATPTPQPITGSALASQHLAVNRSLPWGMA